MRLTLLLSQMSLQIARYTILGLSTPARRTQSIKNWTRLIRAIKDKDTAAAESAARDMVGHTLEFVSERLSKSPELQ